MFLPRLKLQNQLRKLYRRLAAQALHARIRMSRPLLQCHRSRRRCLTSQYAVSEAVVSSILSPVPPELVICKFSIIIEEQLHHEFTLQLTTKKGSKYTDDIGSFGNWGERSTAGFWVEKSALETSYGAEEDTSTFEVEPCSYAMFDDWVWGSNLCLCVYLAVEPDLCSHNQF